MLPKSATSIFQRWSDLTIVSIFCYFGIFSDCLFHEPWHLPMLHWSLLWSSHSYLVLIFEFLAHNPIKLPLPHTYTPMHSFDISPLHRQGCYLDSRDRTTSICISWDKPRGVRLPWSYLYIKIYHHSLWLLINKPGYFYVQPLSFCHFPSETQLGHLFAFPPWSVSLYLGLIFSYNYTKQVILLHIIVYLK